MDCLGERNAPGFGHYLKAHTFRALTAILAWVLVIAAYYQMPELLTSAQRLMQQGIEAIGDPVPSPWRHGWIVFREMGGVIWLQITNRQLRRRGGSSSERPAQVNMSG